MRAITNATVTSNALQGSKQEYIKKERRGKERMTQASSLSNKLNTSRRTGTNKDEVARKNGYRV